MIIIGAIGMPGLSKASRIFPTKEDRWPLSSINAAKRVAGRRSGVGEKILLKILLKTKFKVYLKRT
jgi:hypothetical protein